MRKLMCLLVLLVSLAPLPVRAGEEFEKFKLNATYHAYWGGFVVSTITSHVYLAKDSYKVEVSYKTRGLLSFFSEAESTTYAKGLINADGSMLPLLYKKQGHWGDTHYKHLLEREPGSGEPLTIGIYNEDRKWVREPVPERFWTYVDPMTYMLGLFTENRQNIQTLGEGKDYVSDPVFDGSAAVQYSYNCPTIENLPQNRKSLYDGNAIVCRFSERLLSGKIRGTREYEDKKESRDPQTFSLWVVPWKDLPFVVPVRGEFSTGWGTVKVYLSKLDIEVFVDEETLTNNPDETEQESGKEEREEFMDGNL
ncbi:DUF3108 domain-containing protein [Emcibacter nanhaiensis]|uniref:DUF3108 domain-containing protein n=1 Tax=Emcibacter nanhaiensis TaxID=1505037 RepID=A0A501PTT9_9PROT|nr:DUF3108 domain-containing protein [Emcibacter nanhaiensis]TPD63141.1 DUF3108 domain-containing protein [Emcibacter nanhaiensis]